MGASVSSSVPLHFVLVFDCVLVYICVCMFRSDFLKNCVVHSSSLSYLLPATFGHAGRALATSSLVLSYFFVFSLFSQLMEVPLLFCISLRESSKFPSASYSVVFSILRCFVLFLFLLWGMRYPYVFSLILSNLNFTVSLSHLFRSLFVVVTIFSISLLVSCLYV